MKKYWGFAVVVIISLIFSNAALAVGWLTAPYAVSQTAISMEVAQEAQATEYRFVFVSSPTGGLGGTSSDWQSSRLYTDDGLSINHQYGYRVEARDANGVTIGTSPTVNKYTLTSDPVALKSTLAYEDGIYVMYNAASGNLGGLISRGSSGFIIYCKEVGTNCGWKINNTSIYFSGLSASRRYTFTSKMRNGDGIETAESGEYYFYTRCNNPGLQPFSNIEQYRITANWLDSGNGAGTEYYCENTTKGVNSGWITNTSWICEGLQLDTEYSFRVKARNGAGFETGYVSLGSVKTLDPGKALNPDPSVGEVLIWQDGVTLGWTVGDGIQSHNVYFGTDSYKIADCEPNSSLYQGNVASNSFGPITLEDNTCYYWRIDGVDSNSVIHKGYVWSFTTASQYPVGWWKFDEGTGKVFYDSSGNNNHGTVLVNQGAKIDPNYVTIPNFVPGASGFALQLDGKWHTAYIPHADILKPHQQMTISMWLRADTLVKDGFVFDKGDGGDYGASANVITVSPSVFNFRLNVDGERLDASAPVTPATFADGQWHLYTCTYDGTAMRIYKDGAVKAELPCRGEIGVCDMQNIYLGSLGNYCPDDNPGVAHYDGEIDDLRIYARALSQQEILDMVGAINGATDPAPGNGAKSVDVNTVLSWTGSGDAESFDIYLGTSAQTVEDADTASGEFMANQLADVNSFDPAGLDAGTVYYWRVDEVNGTDIVKGQVWNFETLGNVDASLIGWWTFDEALGNTAYDSSGNDNTGTIAGSPVREEGVFGNAAVFFGTNEYMGTDDESAFDISGNITLSAWVKVSQLDNASMYIISKSGSYYIYKDLNSGVLTFLCQGTGRPVVGTVNIVDGKWHHIVGVYDGVKKYIYVDGKLDKSMNSSGVVTTNNNPLHVGNDAVWPGNEYNGSIDDVRIYNRALSAAEVTAMSDVVFAGAHFPVPTDEAKYVQLNSGLSFAAGSYATSHDIYFGTDYDQVAGDGTSGDTFQGNQSGLTFNPGTLEVETTYYWRVDELNGGNVVTGDVWSFTTTDIEPDPSLVGRWNFDEGKDFTAYDSSGHGHEGLLWGDPQWNITERMGMCLNIGYNKNRVEISDEPSFDITSAITIATWIKNNNGWNYWGDNDAIAHKGTDTWYLRRNGGWGSADSLRFHLQGVAGMTTSDPVTISDNEWHHIAATYNGSKMCIYIDGQLNNSINASGQIATNNTPVWIGNNMVDTTDTLQAGNLKDFRIYNRGLSALEIAAIAIPPYTSDPSPEHKSTAASADVQLSWKAGKGATSHNVYFGDDYFAVNKATVASDVFQANVAANTYSLPTLERRKNYYWRVDAVKGSKVIKGNVWRFYVPCDGGDLEGDVNGDCVVDLKDYAAVAKDWSVGETPVAAANLSYSTLGNSDGIKISLGSILVDLSTDTEGYAQFYSYDGQSLSEPGQPELQWKVVMALLPPDADLASVTARFDEVVYKLADGSWKVRPAGPPALWDPNAMRDILFWPEGKNIVDGCDVDVYKNNAFWPAEEIKVIGTGALRKWKMMQFAVPMLRYNPVSGELLRLAMADISIDFNKVSLQSLSANVYSKTDITGYDRASGMTVNFDQFADNYDVVSMNKASANSGDAEGLAYVIITTNNIANTSTKLNDFVAHKQALGYDVTVVTETNFDDGNSATRRTLDIRNWLINFQNSAPDVLEYVLFIGDPYPDGGGIPMYNSGGDPTDLYYAELDAYSMPFIADVMVGRIPYYGCMADLDKILAKTIDYENQFSNTLQWRKNSLVIMKPLNTSTNPTAGYIGGTSWWLGEQVKNEILIPNDRNYHRIYDVNLASDPGHIMPTPETWPCSDYKVADTWAQGKFGLTMFTTHGAPTGASGVINLALMSDYHDAYPSFLVQCSCSTIDPTHRRNLGYEFLKNQSVTSVGSTTPSYYSPSRTNFNVNDGYCLSQNYQYVKRVVTQGMTAGEGLYGLIAAQTSYTNIYKFNLYGDPSLRLLAPGPADFDGNGTYDFSDLQLLSDEWLEDRN